jgi:hypothetical protein
MRNSLIDFFADFDIVLHKNSQQLSKIRVLVIILVPVFVGSATVFTGIKQYQ